MLFTTLSPSSVLAPLSHPHLVRCSNCDVISVLMSDPDVMDFVCENCSLEVHMFHLDEIPIKQEIDEVIVNSESENVTTHPSPTDENEIEEHDEDCFILDFDPDITFLAKPEQGEVACRDYPHSRHLCANYPYHKIPNLLLKEKIHNHLHCKMCYCFICDEPAPCKQWSEGSKFLKHCDASPDIQICRDLRKHKKIDFNFEGVYEPPEYLINN